MKKTALVILGAAVISAVAGGATALYVNNYLSNKGGVLSSSDITTQWSDEAPKAGNHFTAYQAEQYPDLTYAAENAVKAVVRHAALIATRYSVPERDKPLSP